MSAQFKARYYLKLVTHLISLMINIYHPIESSRNESLTRVGWWLVTIDRRRFGGKRKAKDEMGGDKVSSSQCKFDNKGVVVDDNETASD